MVRRSARLQLPRVADSHWRPPPDGVLPANGEVVFVTRTGAIPDAYTFFILEDGVVVRGPTAAVEPLSDDTYRVVSDEPLQAGVTYAPGFTIGSTDDLEPPESPTFTIERHRGVSDLWELGDFDSLSFQVEAIEARIEVEVTEVGGPVHRFSRVNDSFSFGTDLCSSPTQAYTLDAELSVRARAVDWAGNSSAWVPGPIIERAPPEEVATVSRGCTSVRAPLSAAWLLLVLGLRRRRDLHR